MNRKFFNTLVRILVLGCVIATTSCQSKVATQLSSVTMISSTPTFTKTAQSAKPISTLTPSPLPTYITIATSTPTVVLRLTLTPTSNNAVRLNANSPNEIRTLLIDREGNLWTGGPGGATLRGGPSIVVHWNLAAGKPTVYTPEDGLANDFVLSMTQTGDEAIWVGTFGGGISRFDGEGWQTFTTEEGLPSDYIGQVLTSSDGSLWINTHKYDPSNTMFFGRFVGGKWIQESGGGFDSVIAGTDSSFWASHYETEVGHFIDGKWYGLGVSEVTAISVAPDGEVWAATGDKNIYKYNKQTWERVSTPRSDKGEPTISTIAFGKDDSVWVGFSYAPYDFGDKCGYKMEYIDEMGVYRYDGKNWEHITTQDGLADNKICTIVPGPDGSMWVGTFDRGVSRYDGKAWTTYQVNDFMKK